MEAPRADCPSAAEIVDYLCKDLCLLRHNEIHDHVIGCPDCLAEVKAIRFSLRISLAVRRDREKRSKAADE